MASGPYWAILGCYYSGPTLRIFEQFLHNETGQEVKRYYYTLKGAKRYLKVMNNTQYIFDG